MNLHQHETNDPMLLCPRCVGGEEFNRNRPVVYRRLSRLTGPRQNHA